MKDCAMKKTKSLHRELDMLRQKRRDKAAAKRFFECVLAACPEASKDASLTSSLVIWSRCCCDLRNVVGRR